MIDKVDGHRLGADANKYLIALLVAVRDGWIPPTEVSEESFNHIKQNRDEYPDHLVGFVGFMCSFGSCFFAGFARDPNGGRNYAEVGSRGLTKQSHLLRGIDFVCCDYRDLEIPPNSLIYCDPPYRGVAKYIDDIDHDEFFDWCRQKHSEGHTVFVSEYAAPNDFGCLIEVDLASPITKKGRSKSVEKLFTLKGKLRKWPRR